MNEPKANYGALPPRRTPLEVSMDDAEVCMAAARLIEKRGLAKGEPEDAMHRICALAAIRKLVGRGSYLFLANRVFGGFSRVYVFNDKLSTTQDEVIALLESGAYSLR